MKVNNGLYQICGLLDKKDYVWIPHTVHKLIDYRIELPHYRLWVEIDGRIVEFVQPVNEGMDYLRKNIQEHLDSKRTRRVKVVTPQSN